MLRNIWFFRDQTIKNRALTFLTNCPSCGASVSVAEWWVPANVVGKNVTVGKNPRWAGAEICEGFIFYFMPDVKILINIQRSNFKLLLAVGTHAAEIISCRHCRYLHATPWHWFKYHPRTSGWAVVFNSSIHFSREIQRWRLVGRRWKM